MSKGLNLKAQVFIKGFFLVWKRELSKSGKDLSSKSSGSFSRLSKALSRSMKSLISNDGKPEGLEISVVDRSTATSRNRATSRQKIEGQAPLTQMRRARSIGNLNKD